MERLRPRAVELLGPDEGMAWPPRCAASVRWAVDSWRLRSLRPLPAARGGLVLAGVRDGLPVVVKVPIVDPSRHLRAQLALATCGVGPAVLEADVERGVLLLEFVDAVPLERGGDPAHRRSAAALLPRLHDGSQQEFPDLVDWLRPRLLSEPVDRARHARVSDAHRAEALGVFDELTAEAVPARVVHADVNVGNVLVSRSGHVVLIDARGVCGDPAYDYALLAVKTADRADPVGVLRRRARDLARGRLDNPDRAAAWVVVVIAAAV